jgi:phosphoglycerate dehydrogenase-like enzyme
MTKIALLDDYQNIALKMSDWSLLPEKTSVEVFSDHIENTDKLIERLIGFEVVCAMRERTPFPENILKSLPNLKLLVTTGMRNASIDVAAAVKLGVTVCGTGGLPYPTAELTWGLVLDLARNISTEYNSTRQGKWQTTMGVGLKGKTLGVLGLGNLGSQVANYGKAFGMNIISWSQNLTEEKAHEHGVTLVSLDTLMSDSDFLSIHTTLSSRTRGLINKSKLRLMKPTAYLVNTSRGPIVNESDLIEVLENKEIAGAALDVFDNEPLRRDHSFMELNNVIMTPHIGYVTKETYELFYRETMECVMAFMAGDPIRVIGK